VRAKPRAARTKGESRPNNAAQAAAPDAAAPHADTGSMASSAAMTTALALAVGLYVWTLRRPEPFGNIGLPPEGFRFFPGLPAALGIGLVFAIVIVLLVSAVPALRVRRAGIALAAAGLYLSAGFPALGRTALLIAPIAVAGWLVWIETRKPRAVDASWVLALHAGAFVSALGFYHDWSRYAYGWRFCLDNAAALFKLLFR